MMNNTENNQDLTSSDEKTQAKPKYWMSLEQWRQDEDFQKMAEQEFLTSPIRDGAEEDFATSGKNEGGWARREFLKLMGASMALTSFGCVRRPANSIVPYVKRPSEIIEGIANQYASTFVDGSEVLSVVVTTREGRPINVTGNTLNLTHGGGMSARANAHILSLYDPSRLTKPIQNLLNEKKTNRDTINVTYENMDQEVGAQLKKGQVAVLTSSLMSPSLSKVLNELVKNTNAKIYTWEPVSFENYGRAQELAYGENVRPRLALENAKLVVSVNADFLGTFLQPTQQMNAFSKTRKPGADMGRLIVFESLLTLTGTNADQRHRIRASDNSKVLMGILHGLLVSKKVSSYANDSAILNVVSSYGDIENQIGLPMGTLMEVANQLWENRGRSLVLGGEDLPSQLAAALLNSVLGNDGKTVDYRRSPYQGFKGSTQDLAELIDSMNSGRVRTLIIHGVNPGYALPAEAGFQAAIQKVEMAIYTGDRNDETGEMCNYVAPDHHLMEGWGDHEGMRGLYSIQQPTIRPLYETRAFADSLIAWGQAAGFSSFKNYSNYHDVVKDFATKQSGEDWTTLLQNGLVDKATSSWSGSDSSRNFRSSALSQLQRKDPPRADLELVLYPTVGLKDGSMANVPWLQEFPDPVSKICWDNYASVSPKTARDLHLEQGQVVTLTRGGQTISAPVHIQPGQHDQTIGLALGYGRKSAGEVGSGIGVNGFALAHFAKNETQYAGLTVTMAPTKKSMELACTQGHHTMMGRQIIVESTLEDYKKNPESNIHRHKLMSAWSEFKYEGHKWGMSIDLNLCTGCSACVVACQSENNIPTVGKKYVLKGRIMQWIRLDRYYVGDENNPDAVFMPVLCQHCDNAPCETVCPVAATNHSPEGTNDMIYNRCVGTRYCANNCPYKVRRFNWFNYSRMNPNLMASPMHMQLNPEVTVRERGVMEKCTFCTHKIHQVKNKAKLEDRKVRDGEIITACQSSCPTGAIIFGDLNDPQSQLSLKLKDKRHYSLLEDLNTRPAIQYASKIRNAEKLKGEGHNNHDTHEKQEGGHA